MMDNENEVPKICNYVEFVYVDHTFVVIEMFYVTHEEPREKKLIQRVALSKNGASKLIEDLQLFLGHCNVKDN